MKKDTIIDNLLWFTFLLVLVASVVWPRQEIVSFEIGVITAIGARCDSQCKIRIDNRITAKSCSTDIVKGQHVYRYEYSDGTYGYCWESSPVRIRND